MENNEVNIQKVDLNGLINILVDLYDKGVDYIDITGISGEEKSYMAISFNKSYMSEEDTENFDNIPQDEVFTNEKLSDEDLNQLI